MPNRLTRALNVLLGKPNLDKLEPNVSSFRNGLLFIYTSGNNEYKIVSPSGAMAGSRTYTNIFEIKEIYNDVSMSKVEIIDIPYNKSLFKGTLLGFNPWINSNEVYWLHPSTDIDRENKLEKILK